MSQPRHVLITGASSGIGRALALHMAGEGAVVHAVARRGSLLEELAAEVARSGGTGVVVPHVADVGEPEAAAAVVGEAERRAGRALDVVIANAGVGRQGAAHRLPRDLVAQTVRVNLLGAITTLEAALPAMLARGDGRLAAIASLAGLAPTPSAAAYGATKAGLVAYCRALSAEVRPRGVSVTCVCPGFVRTPMIASTQGTMMVWDADRAARAIAAGIERRRRMVAFPWVMAWAIRATGVLPAVVLEAVYRRMARRWGIDEEAGDGPPSSDGAATAR